MTRLIFALALALSACGEQRIYPAGGSDAPAAEWRGVAVEAPFDFTPGRFE